MNINNFECKLENEWLQSVIKEIQKQLDEKRDSKEKLKKEAIDTQRELWDNVGSVSISNGLEQIADFMSFMDIMKKQKRSHEFTRKLEEKYERMLLSPYFGRLDFLEDEEQNPEKCYIGISNLIDDKYDFLVYDWRAPISSMFYDYEIGQANYKCPEGVVSGKITNKKQYKINNGKIEYMLDSNINIDDEMLQRLLSKSTDSKMKAIVTTIQRDQNKVIRNEEHKNLIVQGPAGSGKTSIALHRIAYLLYKHRDKITPQNIIIFSPNDIFNDYISNVLPQLGEDNMSQTTFKDYMHKELGSKFIKENSSDMMEYILDSKKEIIYQERINNIKFKTSTEFVKVLKNYVSYLYKMDRNFIDITFMEHSIILGSDIRELFFKDYANLPLKRRLQKIKKRILFLIEPHEECLIKDVYRELKDSGSYIEKVEMMEQSKAIVKNKLRDIYFQIDKMVKFDLIDIYKNLFNNLELFLDDSSIEYDSKYINEIKTYTIDNLDAQILNYEDQPPLLYLKGVLGDIPKTSEIKYVIIDEAQDYTTLQYEIFYQLFNSANMTILGDINQAINPFMNIGNYDNIYNISKNDTCIINLTKSYRSTMEITKFSRKILNENVNDEYIERSGEEPIVLGFLDENSIKEKLLEDIKIYKEKGYKSIGIITITAREVHDVYNFLKNKVYAKAILKDTDEYVNDVLVIPSYLAKGLEFDVVLIYNVGNENYNSEDERLLLYTACTRALHILHIYYSGEITPLLK